jgi:hypothetical protein
VSEFGTGFPHQAERALKRGWRVVVWSWREQLSNEFARLGERRTGLQVNHLDKYYKTITFVKGGLYGPPAVPKCQRRAKIRQFRRLKIRQIDRGDEPQAVATS